MREYEIYIIRDEVANTYYGLETKLYHLFLENRSAKGNLKEITDKQIEFIIEKINLGQLNNYLITELGNISNYTTKDNKHYIIMEDSNSQAGLYVYDGYLTLYSEGGYDAEATLFEALRKFHPYFLAIEYSQKRYGWLKPIRPLDVVQHS